MKKIFFFASLVFCASIFAQTIDNSFFEKVNFRGAFGTTNWTSGWANFDPQNTSYSTTSSTIEAGNITANTALGSPFNAPSSFADASLANSFFTPVDYIGAFGQTNWTSGWANFDPQNASYGTPTVTIAAGNITTNTTWTKNNVYLLNGWVYVKDGATLTIEAGTVIRGDKTNKGALIVEKGGKLIANGTAAEPIVFTSNQAAGARTYGDWGGVIICGKAPINVSGGSATIEGGVGSTYGGSDAADNSGSLQYVRIEFPGIAFVTNSEINGLTMGGVGSATTLDYIQVSYSGDDSFEWFGGTVNAKHLIALRGWDDDFDTDFGYTGMVQFGVSLRDPNVADQSKSNCFESDNDASGSSNTPFTAPTFSNMSSFGPKVTSSTSINALYQSAMHLRRNTKIKIFNSVFAGWPSGVQIDGNTTTQVNATNGDLKLKNVSLSGMGSNFVVPSGSTWTTTNESDWFATAGFSNSTFTDNTSLLVNDPFNLTAPNFTPFSTYLLNGWAYVKDGATLTVNPGVVVRGDKTNKGALIIEKGAKLIANGTASQPIVFTSNQAAGARSYGDWGGIILCGKAPINVSGGSATIEGGVGSTYGGSDAADNSGSLQYVRIEFPGIAFVTNSEINGLTMGGVGTGTTLDNIQVSYSGDDSFEWFGGTVNAKHLIALRGWDDDFDTDFGYSGMVQYAVALRDPSVADQSKSNCFESDNDANGSTNSPYTSAVFSNVSSFGPKVTPATTVNVLFQSAMHLRRNTKLKIYNSVFAGWPSGLQVDGNTTTQVNANNGDLKLQNTVICGMGSNFVVPSGSTWTTTTESNWYNTVGFNNSTVVANSDLGVTDAFNLTAPNFLPTQTSALKSLSYWNTSTPTFAYTMPIVAKAYATGSQVTTAGSKLIASKDGISRGWASIDTGSNLFNFTAGSASTTESDIDLQLYDAATNKTYMLPTTFNFSSASSFGTVGTPEVLQATGSQTIALNTGSNWISFNVLPETSTLANVLNYSAQNDDEIISQSNIASYFGGTWYGMSSVEKNKGYVLKTAPTNSTPGSIQISNQPLVKNTALSINAGYNWIGYSLTNNYAIATALNGLAASNDDELITSNEKGGLAVYYGSWFPAEYEVKTGVGYVLKSAAASTFSYPKNSFGSLTKVKKNTVAAVSPWTTQVGLQYAAGTYVRVYKNSVLFQPTGLLLGVFKNDLCYGYAGLSNGPGGILLHILTRGCNNASETGFNYKVYDPNTSTFYNVTETVDFASLVSVGSIASPISVNAIDIATDNKNVIAEQFSVYPNFVESDYFVTLASEGEVNAVVNMYNAQGKLVKVLFSGNINGAKVLTLSKGRDLVSGIYFIKAVVGNKQYTQKVVMK